MAARASSNAPRTQDLGDPDQRDRVGRRQAMSSVEE